MLQTPIYIIKPRKYYHFFLIFWFNFVIKMCMHILNLIIQSKFWWKITLIFHSARHKENFRWNSQPAEIRERKLDFLVFRFNSQSRLLWSVCRNDCCYLSLSRNKIPRASKCGTRLQFIFFLSFKFNFLWVSPGDRDQSALFIILYPDRRVILYLS